jgi:hypothetical protein
MQNSQIQSIIYRKLTNTPNLCIGEEMKSKIKNYLENCWVPEAHAYNPSYSGGRDQEDHGSKPVQANSSMRPYLEKPFTKTGWWSGSR